MIKNRARKTAVALWDGQVATHARTDVYVRSIGMDANVRARGIGSQHHIGEEHATQPDYGGKDMEGYEDGHAQNPSRSPWV
jgi:hypothetical protein